ncbi:hypothetical protein ACFZBP_08575 [Streptomyces sp. NPDC008086]|uniref:hypothetical protein n=1 Tax=Streptomyces sp. NPDC008086 TaxID=3364807 RepID=UPI0036E5F237
MSAARSGPQAPVRQRPRERGELRDQPRRRRRRMTAACSAFVCAVLPLVAVVLICIAMASG